MACSGVVPALAAFAVLLLPTSSSEPMASRVVLERQVFERDTIVEADQVVFAAGARIRIANGARVEIRAKALVFEGAVFVDGRGAPGAAGGRGSTPPRWTSCTRCRPADGAACHDEWQRATTTAEDVGEPGGRGGDGAAGATLDIVYETLRGAPNGVGKALKYDVTGGAGGRGGPGGRGRELGCGCHHQESKRAPDGPNGVDGNGGRAGSVTWRGRPPAPPPNPPPRRPPQPPPGPTLPIPEPPPEFPQPRPG
jgi:hypothetical protein